MNEEIAGLARESGQAATLYDSGTVVVYKGCNRQWDPVRTLPFSLPLDLDMPSMRARIQELIGFLGECRILVALSMGGMPFFELQKAGVKVWEVEGNPVDYLQQIIDDEQDTCLPLGQVSETPPPAPEELEPGHWQVSIRGIQGCGSGLTSKQVLQPILSKGNYQILEVLCDHVPPWLDTKIISGELQGRIDKTEPGDIKVVIFGS